MHSVMFYRARGLYMHVRFTAVSNHLYNSANSALAAYSHVDGNQRQLESAAPAVTVPQTRYIYISTGIDALFISRMV